MRRLSHLTALCVGMLLLAAPAAWACGELGGMASGCPMSGEMQAPMATSMCHDCGQMSKDCCEVRSAPEPVPALSFESAKMLAALEVTDLQIGALTAPVARPSPTPLADSFRLHDLGRYTLFSSFLL